MFKNFKKTDWIIVIAICLIIIVVIAVYFGFNKKLYKTPILAEKDIQFSVFFRGITITDTVSPFKVNENAFITIRNLPYKKLEITDVKFDRRKSLIEVKPGKYDVVDSIENPCLYDFVVTLKDKAKITDDGAVVGGNKIKMGLPITLEGEDYRFNGIVSDLKLVPDTHEAVNNHDTTYDVQ